MRPTASLERFFCALDATNPTSERSIEALRAYNGEDWRRHAELDLLLEVHLALVLLDALCVLLLSILHLWRILLDLLLLRLLCLDLGLHQRVFQ